MRVGEVEGNHSADIQYVLERSRLSTVRTYMWERSMDNHSAHMLVGRVEGNHNAHIRVGEVTRFIDSVLTCKRNRK